MVRPVILPERSCSGARSRQIRSAAPRLCASSRRDAQVEMLGSSLYRSIFCSGGGDCGDLQAMMRIVANLTWLAAIGLGLILAPPCLATDQSSDTRVFGGPDAVDVQIADDAQSITAIVKDRALDPWFAWKASVQERTGFSFGIDYIGLALSESDSPGQVGASRGVARFCGSWVLVGGGANIGGAVGWTAVVRQSSGAV